MKLKLIEKKKEVGNIITFTFKPQTKLEWTAGQYLIYNLPHKTQDLRGKQRFFTISSSPFQKNPTITTRFFGEDSSSFKKSLNKMKIGDEIEAKGPDGDFVMDNLNQKYIFIAGGIGINPFGSIFRELDHLGKKIDVTLLYSNHDENEVLLKDELETFAKHNPKLKIEYVFSPQRFDENYLKNYINENFIYYISGPDPMVDATLEVLKKIGVNEDKIEMDYFSGYKS